MLPWHHVQRFGSGLRARAGRAARAAAGRLRGDRDFRDVGVGWRADRAAWAFWGRRGRGVGVFIGAAYPQSRITPYLKLLPSNFLVRWPSAWVHASLHGNLEPDCGASGAFPTSLVELVAVLGRAIQAPASFIRRDAPGRCSRRPGHCGRWSEHSTRSCSSRSGGCVTATGRDSAPAIVGAFRGGLGARRLRFFAGVAAAATAAAATPASFACPLVAGIGADAAPPGRSTDAEPIPRRWHGCQTRRGAPRGAGCDAGSG
jgi:hypothetical protein